MQLLDEAQVLILILRTLTDKPIEVALDSLEALYEFIVLLLGPLELVALLAHHRLQLLILAAHLLDLLLQRHNGLLTLLDEADELLHLFLVLLDLRAQRPNLLLTGVVELLLLRVVLVPRHHSRMLVTLGEGVTEHDLLVLEVQFLLVPYALHLTLEGTQYHLDLGLLALEAAINELAESKYFSFHFG